MSSNVSVNVKSEQDLWLQVHYDKFKKLNENMLMIYHCYSEQLEKLPREDYLKLDNRLIDLLYEYQTAKVSIDVEQIRTDVAMSNFPSYNVDEREVARRIERLRSIPENEYLSEKERFVKDLRQAQDKQLREQNKVLTEIVKLYVDFELNKSDEKSCENFYKKVGNLIEDNDDVLNINSYLDNLDK